MPTPYSDDLADIAARAREHLELRNRAREQAIPISREVVRLSANAIRAVHRGDFEEAQTILCRADERLKETDHIREEAPEIYHAGFLNDARKEFSEAHVTLAVLSGEKIPQPADLGVEPSTFLNGMAEVIGELRRYILDALRQDTVDRCQEFMGLMDEIYGILVTIDYPEAVTGGLRRSTDQMRGVLERTRGDLTMALRQHRLEAQLARWEGRQSNPD